MFPIPDCSRSIGIHVLLAIAFGIPGFLGYGNTIPANKVCLNVSGEAICYFKGIEKDMNWSDATQVCRSFDSTLPVIRNENDQSAIADYLKSHPKNSSAWTAGKRSNFDDWKWINDEPLKKPDQVQYAEQDQQFGEQDHGAIDQNVKFTAYAAYESLPYICRYVGAHCDSSRHMSEKCLRLINDSRSWYDARNQCLMTNGDLAIIGDAELRYLQQLKLNQSYWIGLRKKSFHWTQNVDVEPNDEIKYTNWDNVFAPYGECIIIGASRGTWGAFRCNELKTVVCQRVLDQGVTSAASTAATLAETIDRFLYEGVATPASTAATCNETINAFLFTYAVIVTICLVVMLIIIITFIVRKYVCHRCSRSITASKSDSAENRRYQDLETSQKQANQDGMPTYAEIKLQPLYEEVRQLGN